MTINFLGTRGNIQHRNKAHAMHSSLLISRGGKRVMIDAGADWLGKVEAIAPDAIVVTHAHPDHVGGLLMGAPCPVYASEDVWEGIRRYPIEHRNIVHPRVPMQLFGITFEAFPVAHSLRAPAVGYRISADKSCVFYVPDVADLPVRDEALRGGHLYIGDGATIQRSMARLRGDALIGHASIHMQIAWCREAHVPRAVFTHCGSQIVKSDDESSLKKIRQVEAAQHVDVSIAQDGMALEMP